jgi:hypothetical protein
VPVRILLVTEERPGGEALALSFVAAGCDVLRARSLDEVLGKVSSERLDAVIAAVWPDSTAAYDVCGALRAAGAPWGLRVYLLRTDHAVVDLEHARAAQADGILSRALGLGIPSVLRIGPYEKIPLRVEPPATIIRQANPLPPLVEHTPRPSARAGAPRRSRLWSGVVELAKEIAPMLGVWLVGCFFAQVVGGRMGWALGGLLIGGCLGWGGQNLIAQILNRDLWVFPRAMGAAGAGGGLLAGLSSHTLAMPWEDVFIASSLSSTGAWIVVLAIVFLRRR